MASHDFARGPDLDDLTHVLSGWPRRWILLALAQRTLCVKELCVLLGFDPPSISKHLSQLERCGLVRSRHDGARKDFELTERIEIEGSSSMEIRMRAAGPKKGMRVIVEFVLDPESARRLGPPVEA